MHFVSPTPPFNVSSFCSNNNTHKCKRLLQYNLIHGNTSMKKHLQNDHIKEFNKYKVEVKAKDGGVVKCKKFKKQKHVPLSSITNFFGGGTSYFKKNHVQLKFIENLVFRV